MLWVFSFLTYVWQNRYRLFLPMLFLPLFVFAWQVSRPALYTVVATLQVDATATSSPVLEHLTKPGNDALLRSTLVSPAVLEDTAKETGVHVQPENLALHLLNNNLIQLSYQTPLREGLEKTLDVLSLNFINELLAPERFRVQQQIQALEDRMREYEEGLKKTKKSLVDVKETINRQRVKNVEAYEQRLSALTFQKERLETQQRLAQKDYEALLVSLRKLSPQSPKKMVASALWFAEPSTVINPQTDDLSYVIDSVVRAFVLGLIFGIVYTMLRQLFDKSLKKDEDIVKVVGVRVLGHIPPLGKVEIGPGSVGAQSEEESLL